MTDESMARPFSGEIMTGGPASAGAKGASRAAGPDIIDAEYVTLPPRPAADSPRAEARPPEAPAAASPGMDILKDGQDGPRRRERGGPLFWTAGLFIVAAAFWVSGGHALVAHPQDAQAVVRPPAAQPLRIVNVESRIERRGARLFLLVDGEVANDGATGATLPGLEISVAAKDGTTTRYFLGTSARALAPGKRFAFSSRLEAPKDGVDTVTVDFRKESGI